jgi:hypothetical protein
VQAVEPKKQFMILTRKKTKYTAYRLCKMHTGWGRKWPMSGKSRSLVSMLAGQAGIPLSEG